MEISIGSTLDEIDDIEDELNTMTFKEFKNLTGPGENLDIGKALKNTLKNLIDFNITDETKIIVKNEEFFKGIHGLLNKVSKPDLVNYMLFGQVLKMVGYTTQNMKFLESQFFMNLGQNPSIPPR